MKINGSGRAKKASLGYRCRNCKKVFRLPTALTETQFKGNFVSGALFAPHDCIEDIIGVGELMAWSQKYDNGDREGE